LARSNVQRLLARSSDWTDARTCRIARADDAVLLDESWTHITEPPTYGYCRACASANRHRAATSAVPINAKRSYRVMAGPCVAVAQRTQMTQVEPASRRESRSPST
jgi:putative transposase